eukprot:4389160-Amphidinium_carterae.1
MLHVAGKGQFSSDGLQLGLMNVAATAVSASEQSFCPIDDSVYEQANLLMSFVVLVLLLVVV